jgi:small subunit ribosomal protein S18
MADNTSSPTLPQFVDYKDVSYLKGFLNAHARMVGARKSDIPAGHQRKIERAVKRARFMGLLPYIAR